MVPGLRDRNFDLCYRSLRVSQQNESLEAFYSIFLDENLDFRKMSLLSETT